jgi:hypothetical protein
MLNSQSLTQFYWQEVAPHLSTDRVYGDVEFFDTDGRFWHGRCPGAARDGVDATTTIDSVTLRWSCPSHCRSYSQSPLAYINGGRFPKPGSGEYRKAIVKAAKLAKVHPDGAPETNPEEELAAQREERVANLLETFFLHAHFLLLDDASREPAVDAVRDYLGVEGFPEVNMAMLSLGVVTGIDAMRAGLREAGFSAQEIEASGLTGDPRLAGRLISPIRDPFGRIVSFWARSPKDQRPRVLYKGHWKDEVGLTGLDRALHPESGGLRNLIVVERVLDALLLQAAGVPNVAAIGGPASELTEARAAPLVHAGVRRITLALCDDADGSSALAAAAHLRRFVRPIQVYVVPAACLEPCLTVAEFVQRNGLPQFQQRLEDDAIHAFCFQAEVILRRHCGPSGWTEAARHAAWKEAIEFHALTGPRHAKSLNQHFIPTIVAGLGRSWSEFEPLDGDSAGPSAAPEAAAAPIAEPVAEVAPPVEAKPLPSAPAAKRKRRGGKSGTICAIHHCDITDCFCFD